MKFRIEKIIGLLAEIIILAIVFFTPLYFGLFLKTNDVFELNKIVLFKILTLVLLLLTVMRLVFDGKELNKSLAPFKGAKLLLALFLVIFLFLIFLSLSTYFSINRETSLFGLYSRWQGFFSNLFYVLFFILLVINIRTNEQILRIVKAVVFSSFLVSLYGLAQAAGYDPLPWAESSQLRAFSTLGQPNFLAIYFLLSLPMSLFLALRSLASFIEAKLLLLLFSGFFYFIALFANLACLLVTYSLSGWAGFIGGVLFTSIIYLIIFKYFKSDNLRQSKMRGAKEAVDSSSTVLSQQCEAGTTKQSLNKVKLILSVIILIMSILSIFAIAQIYNKWTLRYRLSSLFNLQSASLTSRYNWWRASQQAIFKDSGAKQWLFGYGPERQSDVLVKYYQKNWGVYENVNVRPDRAHNLFLDILLTTGLAGFITYLLLLSLFFYLLFKIIKKIPEFKWLAFCILLGLISYLFSLQLNFKFVVGEIYFWLYLSLAAVIIMPSRGFLFKEAGDNSKDSGWLAEAPFYYKRKLQRGGVLITNFIIICFIGFFVFWQIKEQINLLAADHYFLELREARIANQYFGALKMYEFIKENAPKNLYYERQFAVIMSGWIEEFSDPRFKKFGAEKLALVLKFLNSDNYDDIYARAVILKALANKENQEYFAEAEDAFKKLTLISPEMPRNYIELAGLYAKWEKNREAIEAYKLAANKLPDLNHPDINADHRRAAEGELYNIYLSIGDIYFKENNFNQAENYYNQALDLNEKIVNAYGKLADLKLAASDFEKAIWYNKKAMEIDKKNYKWPLAIGQIYEKMGKNYEAETFIQKARDLAGENLPI